MPAFATDSFDGLKPRSNASMAMVPPSATAVASAAGAADGPLIDMPGIAPMPPRRGCDRVRRRSRRRVRNPARRLAGGPRTARQQADPEDDGEDRSSHRVLLAPERPERCFDDLSRAGWPNSHLSSASFDQDGAAVTVPNGPKKRRGGTARPAMCGGGPGDRRARKMTAGEVAERSIATVLKTVDRKVRGFESHPLRQHRRRRHG